jgi:hypothetical protein
MQSSWIVRMRDRQFPPRYKNTYITLTITELLIDVVVTKDLVHYKFVNLRSNKVTHHLLAKVKSRTNLFEVHQGRCDECR